MGTLNWNQLHNIHDSIRKQICELDEPYIVITTPTELTCINDTDVVLTIDAQSYTFEKLKDIFEKANNYEDLCK